MEKYEIIKNIGGGTFGSVFEGINKETNKKVAIKKIRQKFNSYEECLRQNEVKLLHKLKNENIINLLEVIQKDNKDSFLIFEYCNCSLYDFMRNHRKQNRYIPESKIKDIIYQITSGLAYLHSLNIMHRDLKPENILMIAQNNQVKIADFGTAKEFSGKNNAFTDYVCTRWYRAPECVLKSKNYNEKIDIWALGCIMAELYNLKPLFPGNTAIDQLNKIVMILGKPEYNEWIEGYNLIEKMNMEFPSFPKKDLNFLLRDIDDNGIDFLKIIFQYDHNKRPSAIELLNHPYFNNIYRKVYPFNSMSNYNNFPYNNNLASNNLNELQKNNIHFTNNDAFFNSKPRQRNYSSFHSEKNIVENNKGLISNAQWNACQKNNLSNEINYNCSRLSSIINTNMFQNRGEKLLHKNQSALVCEFQKKNIVNEMDGNFFNLLPSNKRRINFDINNNTRNFGNFFLNK